MTSVVVDGAPRSLRGGRPARRAVLRWSYRLFRREWRQQVLVILLVGIAVAATTFGLAFATNAPPEATTTVTIPGTDSQLADDIAAITKAFPRSEVMHHQPVAIPGSVATIDLRAPVSNRRSYTSVGLVQGRFPSSAREVSLTSGASSLLGVGIGGTWTDAGRGLQVVGIVDDPNNKDDDFAFVVAGAADPPATVTVFIPGTTAGPERLRLPSHVPVSIEGVSSADHRAVALAVLALGTMGLLFVGLVAVAGFAVVAQRHLRALGVLGSLGGTDRQMRLVLAGDGAAVGTVGAIGGCIVGLIGWFVFAPRLAELAGHRVDRLDVPWWAVVVAAALAVVTAALAAWWPARAAARGSIIAALSGRPPKPRPARTFTTAGVVLVAAGVGVLVLANRKNPLLLVAGLVATMIGTLLLVPLALVAASAAGGRARVAVRLATRDLVRYRARAGAALGAVALALAIALTITVAAAYENANHGVSVPNLPPGDAMVYLSDPGAPIPDVPAGGLAVAETAVTNVAAAFGTKDVTPLEQGVDPTNPDRPSLRGSGQSGQMPAGLLAIGQEGGGKSIRFVQQLYVATPALLDHDHIPADQIDPNADVILPAATLSASRLQLGGDQLALGANPRATVTPVIQTFDIDFYGSQPTALITAHGMQRLGLEPVTAAWLVRAPQSLPLERMASARKAAASAGLQLETRKTERSFNRIGTYATGVGMLVALCVLAMTVGLIRAETAHELRTLTATGAPSSTRRMLTAVTSATLAFLGAVLGAAAAYLVMISWYHHKLGPMKHVPVVDLLIITVALPAGAGVAGFVLGGREPPVIARHALM